MVVAKSDLAYRSFVKQLRYRQLSREYLAIVKGKVEGRGTVDAPIGRHVSARKKMAVRVENGKSAVTHFRAWIPGEKASLLLVKLETGRTHQIRVHMQYIHHPVWGDQVYGGSRDSASRQMLHAFRISFKHPKTGRVKTFQAPPPKDFEEALLLVDLKKPDWKKFHWD